MRRNTKELTEKQKELYDAIKDFIKVNGYPPTIRELNEIINVKSTAPTFNKLRELKEKGYISYANNKSRTIKILK